VAKAIDDRVFHLTIDEVIDRFSTQECSECCSFICHFMFFIDIANGLLLQNSVLGLDGVANANLVLYIWHGLHDWTRILLATFSRYSF